MTPELYRKRVFCADLAIGDAVEELFCIERVERRSGKGGAYLRVTLVDRTGSVTAMVWDDVDSLLAALTEGGYARIRGEVETWRGEPQLKISGAESWTEEIDPADFLRRGPIPGEVSLAGIRDRVGESRWVDGEADAPSATQRQARSMRASPDKRRWRPVSASPGIGADSC